MPDPVYRWNDLSGRFIDSRGRFVPEKTVRDVVDKIADDASAKMAAISQSLVEGKTTLANWEIEMRRLVKVSNSATAVLANGGAGEMSPSRWGSVGQTVRQEYGYLRQMGQDIASGAQPLDGRLVARSRLYGQNARTVFETTRGRGDRARGYTQERNILHAVQHCAGCVAESARGWVPIGELVPIGSRQCKSNDRCTIERRKEPLAA